MQKGQNAMPKIKAFSSCIRSVELREHVRGATLLSRNPAPRTGQIVITQVTGAECGYPHMENEYGRDVALYPGDILAGVLGKRCSGTNLSGVVPELPIEVGGHLHLLSIGGLVGQCRGGAGAQPGGRPRELAILGFPRHGDENFLMIRCCFKSSGPFLDPDMSQCAIFIFGTSADVGKTTLAVRLTRAAKEDLNRTPVAYFKVCGTGRLRDLYRVLDAGADLATDFVDAGYPSTYDMPACEYKRLLQAFYHTQRGQKGIMIFEVGGDIIDVNALVAVRYAADVSASIVIVANDAIGAIGARDLAVETVPKLAPIFVATMRQNPQAMAERMCLSEVVDIRADSDVKLLLAKARRHAQRHPTMTNSR